jgi:hypothetical protein
MTTEIKNLITEKNNELLQQVLVISKQDIALKNAINALNELKHINRIEFTAFGNQYGINNELLSEVRDIQDKLTNARYGRF